MLEFYSLDDVDIDFGTCVTIGNFDGVHIGHQILIKRAVDYSKKNNLKSVVFTFSNHPVNYFRPGTVKNIITLEGKKNLVKSLGVDVFIAIPFDKNMTEISAFDYVKNILIDKLHSKYMVIGHDFSFARNREGNPQILTELMKPYNCGVEVIEPVLVDGRRISSTDIRRFLTDGMVDEASKLLGRNYFTKGKIIHGRQIGRKLGFRTANIEIDKSMVIPGIGIYSTYVYIDNEKFLGATSIGTNPTVYGRNLSLEVHIIDFNRDIYGEIIKIEFVDKIRDEEKFSSMQELKEQLAKDVETVISTLVL